MSSARVPAPPSPEVTGRTHYSSFTDSLSACMEGPKEGGSYRTATRGCLTYLTALRVRLACCFMSDPAGTTILMTELSKSI